MPNYKNGAFFHQLPQDSNFDMTYPPGHLAPFSGIYRCTSCGFEAVSTAGNTLPPTRSCISHSVRWRCAHGDVRWQLVAAAVHVSQNA